ncbi:putative ABC-type nitrate transporter [Helianthus annuus]|nr:putative ABC-type nitrate transporter [Helianthus annuus]
MEVWDFSWDFDHCFYCVDCGTAMFRFKKLQGSPLLVIWKVVFLAIKNRNHMYPANLGFLK